MVNRSEKIACQQDPSKCKTKTYSCLPKIGASPLIWVPRAARTCWDGSETRSSTELMISLRSVSRSTRLQKPGIWPAIAVRTSASLSLRSLTKAGTKSRDTTSSSTALAICDVLSARRLSPQKAPSVPFQTYRQPYNGPSSSYLLSGYGAM